MPTFTYSALSLSGSLQQGKEVAESLAHLREMLAARDLILKSARQTDAALPLIGGKVPLSQIAGFNRQFVVLLKAGIPIPEALSLLVTRPGQPRLQAAIASLLDDVRRGTALSVSAAKLPRIFEASYCATIAVGEQAGSLAQALEHYQNGMDLRLRLRKQIGKALFYPAVLALTLAAVLVFLFLAVIPNFVAMYNDLGGELPAATSVLIFIAENFLSIAACIGGIVVGLVALDFVSSRTPEGRRQKHQLMATLPLIGGFRRVAAAAETARILATLVLSGMPVARAFAIASQSLSDRHFGAMLGEVNQAILSGEPVSQALGRYPLFPPVSLKMLAAGEASGSLDRMLVEIATHHESEVEQSLTRLTSLIEPMLTLLAGLVVGGVIVAMYLPMFSLMESIK